ncbi:beta-ketoacyl [acyl carrier protein] synthase domain-containing protein [Glaciimonas sp. GG7]
MEAIAITGISCQFAGARDTRAFWRMIVDNTIIAPNLPTEREALCDQLKACGVPDFGGYIDDIHQFDAPFFNVSARDAVAMDPQQRLLLRNAWHAIEDSGMSPADLQGTRCGVFVGAMSNDWAHVLWPDLEQLTPHMVTGNGLGLLANRISYQLDLKGPSVTTDSACASSLVALHAAMRSLRDGECDTAIVAGVTAILTPTLQIFYQRAGIAAPDGRCKPFSTEANGIVRAEGVGVLFLQRLSDAQHDGRAIYATLLGSHVNHNGRSNGITAPNRFAQEDLLASTYASIGLPATAIGYIECHGTGTAHGDHIEARALQNFLHNRNHPCPIGAVKGLIGHTESAAGVAGVIKAALMLKHRYVPAGLYADKPNPVLTKSDKVALVRDGYPMVAGSDFYIGVSAFGIGGTNAHVVLA